MLNENPVGTRKNATMHRIFTVAMLIIAASFWNNSLAENKSRAESHEMRMLMLSSVPSMLLDTYLTSATPVVVTDAASFSGEVINFTPTKEELKNALESVKLMQEADSFSRSNTPKALSLYQSAFAKNPFDPILLMSIGAAQYHVGQKAMARETMKKAYDLAPDGYSEKPRIQRNLKDVQE